MATTSPMIGSPIACLLKLAQSDGVGAHQRQNRQTKRHESDVEHDRLLAGAAVSAGSRKLSIVNWGAQHKDFISFKTGTNRRGAISERRPRGRSDRQGKGKRAGLQTSSALCV